MDLISNRFSKSIILTHHAIEQMEVRHVDEATLYDLIESGKILRKDDEHL